MKFISTFKKKLRQEGFYLSSFSSTIIHDVLISCFIYYEFRPFGSAFATHRIVKSCVTFWRVTGVNFGLGYIMLQLLREWLL